MCCDRTDCESPFHSMGEGIAKPLLPMAFPGQTEERDTCSRFPVVRLLVLINDDRYVGWQSLMALNVIRIYFNKMCYEMGSQYSF